MDTPYIPEAVELKDPAITCWKRLKKLSKDRTRYDTAFWIDGYEASLPEAVNLNSNYVIFLQAKRTTEETKLIKTNQEQIKNVNSSFLDCF
jgi:hypothetical protein